MTDRGFLRRVKHPNPIDENLARQAVDALEARRYHEQPNFGMMTQVCHEFGIGINYVLDEIERRVRERTCAHRWARRRDGRWCRDCDRVEFGLFTWDPER